MTEAGPLVVGLGEVLCDRFPNFDRPGGAPANFAFHAGQLGARARIVSRIGSDAEGDWLSGLLYSEGMTLDFLQRDSLHPTGVVLVQLHNGQPTYTIATRSAWDFLEMTEEMESLAANTDCVCFGTLAQRESATRNTIQEFVRRCPASSLRIFDINLRQSFYDRASIEFGLEHAGVLKLNGEELERISEIFGLRPDPETAISWLLHQFALHIVALTKGADGCEFHTPTEKIVSAVPRVTFTDAVGAGDAFSAALAMGLLRGQPLPEIADQANRVGAFVASQAGAFCRLPAELLEI